MFILSCHGLATVETFFKHEDKHTSVQDLGVNDSESSITESENARVLVRLEKKHLHRFFLTKHPLKIILTTKWTPMAGFTYPTNKQGPGRCYNEGWETIKSWLRYCLSDDSAFCANCFASPRQISAKSLEFIKSVFRD